VNSFSKVNIFGQEQQRLLLASPLSKSEKGVLISLKSLQGLNLYRISKSLDIPESTVKLAVRRMVSKGILERGEEGVFLTRAGKRLFSLLLGSSSNIRMATSKVAGGREIRSDPTKKIQRRRF